MNHSPEEPGQEPQSAPLGAEEETLVKEAEDQIASGSYLTPQEVRSHLRERRAEWIRKNQKSA